MAELMPAILRAAADRFRQTLLHVALVEQPLPLQIAELDVIAVDDPQEANAGPRQRARLKAP